MDVSILRNYHHEDANDPKYEFATDLPLRPKIYNTSGREAIVRINSWPIIQYPQKPVNQYDVLIGSGTEKRALVRKVWASPQLKKLLGGPSWIFDGNKIAWSQDDKGQITTSIDLDADEGITPRPGRENKHRVVIRKTNRIAMSSISAFLSGKMSFDNSVLEAINFLDHLLRESPSKHLTSIKQSFYARGEEHYSLGLGIEAFKGVYQTIRMCQGGRLGINVDVSNGTFWAEMRLQHAALGVTGITTGIITMIHDLKPVRQNERDKNSKMVRSPAFHELKRLHKVAVYVTHRGVEQRKRPFVIDHFLQQTSREYKFSVRDKETGQSTETTMFDYFWKRYNIRLEWPDLPVVQTTKKGVVLPMEVMTVQENQRYPFKLNAEQTSKMIKFAVTKPQKRLEDIEFGRRLLDWEGDQFLKGYGMGIAPQMLETKARVLSPPVIQFAGSTATPGTSGRWDLKGKKFLGGNTKPLRSWGVCIFKTSSKIHKTVPKPVVENFIREFIKVYQGHGGVVQTKDPPIIEGPVDAAEGVNDLFQHVGNKYQERPQIMLFVLPDRTSFHYLRVKKSADCRFGVLSQCMQADHMYKLNNQYMSNVCMKLNAKLGGTTSRVAGKNPTWGHFPAPSIMIGADVSHGPPMSEQPSMAAVSLSWDKYAARYIAACETNGFRVEMITKLNIESMVTPMVADWIKNNGGNVPQHVYYFRDGVSEGQFQHVLQQEVRDMRIAFRNKFPNWNPKFIVIVASKRHHIRFFPKQGDSNGNPLPGTLVEKDVTHPFENDFYLCSHKAIQGTARPVHYHVLLDEAGLTCNQLHGMIYEHCYQYIRSTTPVSLHPAVYYAHLASNRARSHENIPKSSGPHQGPGKIEKPLSKLSSAPPNIEVKPLLPMPTTQNIHRTMWYI
ncbi:MAG: hypothetical protein M1837_002860 [Sclerophora amabilis]|nr:MAG: hypothetical protein M1837_002860 [Sclerophora amabilis]